MFSSVFVPFKGPFRRFEITAPRRVEPGGLSGPSASVASADPAIDWTTSAALCTASQLSPAMGWDGQTISGSGTRKSAINRCAYIYICVCVCQHAYLCVVLHLYLCNGRPGHKRCPSGLVSHRWCSHSGRWARLVGGWALPLWKIWLIYC